MFHYTITEYNLFPVWEALRYLRREEVPKVSSVPDGVYPIYGFVLSSRRGPPVKYQIIHTAQKTASALMKNPMRTSI